MKRTTTGLMFLLLYPALLFGQSVKLPPEVKVDPGRLAAVKIEWEGDDVKWVAPSELDVFREYDPDSKVVRLRLMGSVKGRFPLHAVAAKGGKLSDFATCYIVIGEVPPGPIPPDPPVPPDPPTPAPIQGKRCLIIEETEDRTKLPGKQRIALDSQQLFDYLESHTEEESDKKHRAWRIWDKDETTKFESKTWQDAMTRFKGTKDTKTPWIIVSNGKTGYEGPLPATLEEIMTLLRKYLD